MFSKYLVLFFISKFYHEASHLPWCSGKLRQTEVKWLEYNCAYSTVRFHVQKSLQRSIQIACMYGIRIRTICMLVYVHALYACMVYMYALYACWYMCTHYMHVWYMCTHYMHVWYMCTHSLQVWYVYTLYACMKTLAQSEVRCGEASARY